MKPSRSRFSIPSMMDAVRADDPLLASLFLKLGHPVNPSSGASFLAMAAKSGAVRVASFLIEAGADPHGEDLSGVCALSCAVDARDTGMARLLLRAGAQPSRKDTSGISPKERLAELRAPF